jgi:hypothetical protein
MPFQKGNKLAARRMVFTYELRKALHRSPEKLRQVVEKLLNSAADGDMWAIKELADRLDGKAHQTIHGTFEHTVETGDAETLDQRLLEAQRARTLVSPVELLDRVGDPTEVQTSPTGQENPVVTIGTFSHTRLFTHKPKVVKVDKLADYRANESYEPGSW